MTDREFWVAFDYGMGGIWAIARAGSEAEIESAFPELEVIQEAPTWMTPEIEQKLRSVSSFVVADPNTYPEWLRTLVSERDAS